jgi:hypothetical protein
LAFRCVVRRSPSSVYLTRSHRDGTTRATACFRFLLCTGPACHCCTVSGLLLISDFLEHHRDQLRIQYCGRPRGGGRPTTHRPSEIWSVRLGAAQGAVASGIKPFAASLEQMMLLHPPESQLWSVIPSWWKSRVHGQPQRCCSESHQPPSPRPFSRCSTQPLLFETRHGGLSPCQFNPASPPENSLNP